MNRLLSVLGALLAHVVAGSTPAAADDPVACAAACEAQSVECVGSQRVGSSVEHCWDGRVACYRDCGIAILMVEAGEDFRGRASDPFVVNPWFSSRAYCVEPGQIGHVEGSHPVVIVPTRPRQIFTIRGSAC